MSEQIQRWAIGANSPFVTDNGAFVTYSDHVAAVAAARKQGEQDQIDLTRDWGLHQHEVGRLQGQRDERERIRQAVEEELVRFWFDVTLDGIDGSSDDR
jgi:hypothetical protein